jgi:hypothetical protein
MGRKRNPNPGRRRTVLLPTAYSTHLDAIVRALAAREPEKRWTFSKLLREKVLRNFFRRHPDREFFDDGEAGKSEATEGTNGRDTDTTDGIASSGEVASH